MLARLRILATSIVRSGQGLARLGTALPRRNKAAAVRGLVDLTGAVGKLTEITVYRP